MIRRCVVILLSPPFAHGPPQEREGGFVAKCGRRWSLCGKIGIDTTGNRPLDCGSSIERPFSVAGCALDAF